MQLVIDPRRELVRCVYGEEIDLHALGSLTIARASYVEPDESGCWWADYLPFMAPIWDPFFSERSSSC